jgi:hypothetical protein
LFSFTNRKITFQFARLRPPLANPTTQRLPKMIDRRQMVLNDLLALGDHATSSEAYS